MNDQPTFAPGSRVLVRHNPHDPRAEDVDGVVTGIGTGAGFGGCDLIHVRYASGGAEHERPFTNDDLNPATPEALRHLAERLEAQAAELRRIAGDLPG